MAHALRFGFVVVTHDLDFGAILAATKARGPSVVQIRSEDVSPDRIGGRVIDTLRQLRVELGGRAVERRSQADKSGLLPLGPVE